MLLHNSIRTPDGTVLISRHRHDYLTYTDANGKWYMLDGGLDYCRRSANGDEEDLSVEDDGTIELAREHLSWGTYGKNPDYPEGGFHPTGLRYVKIKDMSCAHIEAILEDAMAGKLPISGQYLRYFKKEQEYRSVNNIEIKD